jgi:glycolate oxidase FAD binding subunit
LPGAVLEKLAGIVGAEHVLTGVALSPYVVDGRTPEAAVFPASADEVRRIVTLAGELGTPLVPWGGGTAVSVGTPSATHPIVLGLRRLDRIVEHEPGDLTATVEGGVTMAALDAALRARRQWLSIDPPDPARATIAGVVAANASGPRRHLYGTMRDLLLGVTVVTADGTIVRGGGKVVKNVAGYDLPKLFVGSYGTLGVIVEVTVKLRPVPDDERVVLVSLPTLKEAGVAIRAVMASDLIPTAIDVLDAGAARGIGAGAAPALIVGFDGLGEQVDAQCADLARLVPPGSTTGMLPREAWPRVATAARDAFDTPASVMRLSVLPGQVVDTIEEGTTAARAHGLPCAWSAHAGAGIVTGALAPPRDPDRSAVVAGVLGDWRRIACANGGFATLEWAPLTVKEVVPVWDDLGAAGRIMQRIKAQLDPKNILNPGRFVAGI